MFHAKVGGKFAAFCVLDSDVDTHANSLREGLLSTAEEVLVRERRTIQPRVTNEVLNLVLIEEVEVTVRSLKAGKDPGMDNIPSGLLKNRGEATTTVLTGLCQKIWETKEWPKEWTQSLVIPLPKKGNLKQCQNYRTTSLISHPGKIMLRVILNRLKAKAEEVREEEQADFRPGRSTVEQTFNCRVIIEKHLQHQRDLFYNLIDFK